MTRAASSGGAWLFRFLSSPSYPALFIVTAA